MEKICEFCLGPRPIIFCKSDSAFLCLSCDSRVHSANALSGKHSRTLLCESCRDRVAFALCLDHRMLFCRACDAKLHHKAAASSAANSTTAALQKHRRRMVGAFTGCPSAKQFAALWGFEAGDLDNGRLFDQLCGGVSVSGTDLCSVASTSTKLPPHTTQGKDSLDNQTRLILHQILDLKRLQLTEASTNQMPSRPSLIRERVNSSNSSFSAMYTNNSNSNNEADANPSSAELDASLDDGSGQGLKSLSNNGFLQFEEQHFNSPLAQLDYSPSTDEISPLGHDPFWQSESTLESTSQFWSQNLEELGMCQERPDSFDDFNIPELDKTFRNFDELLGSDEDLSRALSDDTDTGMWSADKDTLSGDKSETSHTMLSQMNEDFSASSLFHHTGKSAAKEDTLINNPPARNHHIHEASKPIDISSLNTIRSSYSASYSFSRLSTESSVGGGDASSSDDLDSGNSPGPFADCESKGQGQGNSLALGSANSSSNRCKERKKAKMDQRTSQLAPRKAKKIDTNKSIKSRFSKVEASEPTGHANVTRSF